VSYSATLMFREKNGDMKTEKLLDKCMENIKKILGKPTEPNEKVQVDVMNEFYMVMSRKPGNL
jgi:hypothetical protein